jgi:hypothetical protein
VRPSVCRLAPRCHQVAQLAGIPGTVVEAAAVAGARLERKLDGVFSWMTRGDGDGAGACKDGAAARQCKAAAAGEALPAAVAEALKQSALACWMAAQVPHRAGAISPIMK